MIKSWWVVCKVNMDASKQIKVIVKANTERKAKSFAIDRLHKEGYFHVVIESCNEMIKE